VLAPFAAGGAPINVHSKLCIVDDELLKIGSANLSARSMALDSECDVVLESGGRPDLRQAIRGLRARLLGEHLGVSAREFEAACASARGSLIRAIDALAGGERRLARSRAASAPRAPTGCARFPSIPRTPRRCRRRRRSGAGSRSPARSRARRACSSGAVARASAGRRCARAAA
jgi:hypothetical protein